MSSFLTCRISQNLRRSVTNTKLKRIHSNNGRKNLARYMSHESNEQAEVSKFVPFLDMIEARRTEARKSILVQVHSAQSFKQLHSYCSSFGTVKQMFHYTAGVEPKNFIIVEFAKENDVHSILSASSYLEDSHVIPVHSQFLWFKTSDRKLPKLKQSKNATLAVEDGNAIMKDADVRQLLKNCETISDQMITLYNCTKLNDIGTRLRFLTARQIESGLQGMFPHASAIPFGSSVNGYGKMGCDLDLVLRLNESEKKNDARLVFHCKAGVGSERANSQRNMESIGDLIQLFLPGCGSVRRILQARVPIIKYYQQLTDVECDLSMSNMSGVHMSDFLYLMGSIDERIRPLIFTIRKWALEVGLTNSSPGRWITNFSLTLLVLAFLQKPINSSPILPSLNTLVKLAGPKDTYMTEDGINCTFLRNINQLDTKTENKESLESLLKEFFEFYSQFDFNSKAICLNEAVSITKPEFCAIYIVNPLERGLNVSKNVSPEELERFKIEARNAAWTLECQENKTFNWGILSIFENKRKPSIPLNFNFSKKQNRMMDIKKLFNEDDVENIEFKNEAVKKQVANIQNERKNKIEELQKVNR